MRNRSWIAAAVATAGVVVGVALSTDVLTSTQSYVDGPATAPASAPAEDWCVGTVPGPDDGETPDDTPLHRTLTRIEKLAAGPHSDVYTGLSVDESDNAADVWRIPSDLFDTDVCDAAEEGVKLRLHPADANRKDLDALADRISEDMKRWDGTFQLREVGVDERGFVHVGVDDPKKAEPLIKEEFGPRYIKVEHVGQAQAGVG